jgi:hypothetical protein
MPIKNPKWNNRYNDLLMEALEKGIVDFSMTGRKAMLHLAEHKDFAVIPENYSEKQVKNALGRLKEAITPTETKVKEATEKMSINNELKKQYSKYCISLQIRIS